MFSRPRVPSALGAANRQVSLRIERRPAILKDTKLRFMPGAILALFAMVYHPFFESKDPAWVVLVAVVFFLAPRAVSVGWSYRRIRPMMNMHGWCGRGGRKEVRAFVSSLERQDDPLTLELIGELCQHSSTLAASEFWGSAHMAPCRDRLDPLEILRRVAMSLSHGASLAQIARFCDQADELSVIAAVMARIDTLPRSSPLRSSLVGLPLPASPGAGDGLDIEPVFAWAQAADVLMESWKRASTEIKLIGRSL